jgi:hypothetical protein
MTRKPKSKPESKWDDPEESQRFLDAAKTAEASDDPKDFDRALTKIAAAQKVTKTPRHLASFFTSL